MGVLNVKDSSLVRMSFSIEPELFSGLETLVREHGYGNRSEFVRDMIRKQLAKRQCASCGEVIGTLSVLCDLTQTGVEAKLAVLLDGAGPKVLGATRFAAGNGCSSTMITVTGIGHEIRALADSIRKLRGVIQTEFVITSPAACCKEKKH